MMRAFFDRLRLRTILACQRGATAVEYGLILSLIFFAMVVALKNVSSKTINMWGNVANAVTNN